LLKRTAFAIVSAALAAAAFGERPPLVPEDVWAWRSAGDPRIAAGGDWVAYVESWNDRPGDAEFSNLWVVSSNGKTRRQLTQGNWGDRSPRWSPDGARIAWLSDRSGRPQVWVRKLESGPETQVTNAGRAPLSLAWSPDGESIALTALVPSKMDPPAWAPPAIVPRLRSLRQGYVHLFVVPASGGAARQISSGDFDDTGEPAWMADGRSILAARDDGEIYSIRISDGSAKQLTRQGGRNEHPAPSSDGSKIAWLATDGQAPAAGSHQSYAVRKVWVMNADGSRARVLTGSLDRDAAEPQWSPDSRTVYFLADDRGSTHVYAARDDGTVRQATSAAERLRGFSLAANGRAVAVRSTASEAGAVYTFTVDRVSQPAVLAAPNEHLLAEREIAPAEEIDYLSDGNTIQAWVVKPPAFDATKKYPLLLDVGDDRREMYGVDFNLRAQIFAARGLVVLCVNPRGTPGYGEVFGNLLRTRDPGDAFDDLMRGVEFVASKGWIDTNRLAVAGGLVAAWAIGHTDRFRAAVVERLSVDRVGPRWEDPDRYVKHSPIFFARDFQTPTLVLAGDPDPESDELYLALQWRKVDSALVRMGPAEKPGERVLELETISSWLRR